VQIYYPPLFRVSAEPGGFRAGPYADPSSPVLANENAGAGGGVAGGAFAAAPPPALSSDGKFQAGVGAGAAIGGVDAAKAAVDQKDEQATRTLVDKYRNSSTAGRATGILPIAVNFPAFGPSVYLVTELTSENQFPQAALIYQQDKKRGVK
jgi:hypothetical protein